MTPARETPVTTRAVLRQTAATVAGPVLSFALTLGRIVILHDLDAAIVVAGLFAAVVAGAAFGGRLSALATVAVAAVGLSLTVGDRLGPATLIPIGLAVAVALVTGELRDRAQRDEHIAAIANARLRRLALRDPLTGLLDRRGFDLAIGVELAREARRGGRFALLILDLRGMPGANERFGRSVGETLIQVFGDSLEARIRQSDIAARVADTEFAVILPDTDLNGAEEVARQVIKTFLENLVGIVPTDLDLEEGFGIARFPNDGKNADSLLAAATKDLKTAP